MNINNVNFGIPSGAPQATQSPHLQQMGNMMGGGAQYPAYGQAQGYQMTPQQYQQYMLQQQQQQYGYRH